MVVRGPDLCEFWKVVCAVQSSQFFVVSRHDAAEDSLWRQRWTQTRFKLHPRRKVSFRCNFGANASPADVLEPHLSHILVIPHVEYDGSTSVPTICGGERRFHDRWAHRVVEPPEKAAKNKRPQGEVDPRLLLAHTAGASGRVCSCCEDGQVKCHRTGRGLSWTSRTWGRRPPCESWLQRM